MSRYQTSHSEDTDYYRWHAEDPNTDFEDWSGEYRTVKAVKSGIRYDRIIQEEYHKDRLVTYTIQKLEAVHEVIPGQIDGTVIPAMIPVLKWVDVDV